MNIKAALLQFNDGYDNNISNQFHLLFIQENTVILVIAGQICNKFWANCTLFDENMKFGSMLDKAILSIFRVDAKLKNSISGGHLEFQNGRH